jgi:hypothetical protein
VRTPADPWRGYQNDPMSIVPTWLPNTPGVNSSGGQDINSYSPEAGTPGVVGPPPAPPQQDFGAYLKTDPGYAALLASLKGQQSSLLTQFGDASGQVGIDGSPIGADVQQAAAANPYSFLAQDRLATRQHVSGINNSANAHGLLYSGANVQGQVNEYGADQQRQYAARAALQNALGGLSGQQAQGTTDAYQNYLNSLRRPA